MNSWWFRTKPRSILKTLRWFPHFAALENENWNYQAPDKMSRWNDKPIHPARRDYIYRAHLQELEERYPTYDDYLSGLLDENETESTGRNDKTTFEFYGLGYVAPNGLIKVTEAGQLVNEGRADENLLIRQLLKMRFPSPSVVRRSPHRRINQDENFVFPMEVILNVFKHFDHLNKFELGFLFGCTQIENLDQTIKAITKFRNEYEALTNKKNIKSVTAIFNKIFNDAYPEIKNKPETYYKDYADALVRTLEYTGLFSQRGRGYYVKLFVPEHAKVKMKLLQENYEFTYYDENNFEKYMEWFGNPYNITLPWENKDNIKEIITNKVELLKTKLQRAETQIVNFNGGDRTNAVTNLLTEDVVNDKEALTKLDQYLTEQLVSLNEELFIKYHSKTEAARVEILEKFNDIIEGNEDMAALWLECNTWKSLVAIEGRHYVKRNFKIEEDLTPKAFAPGVGNTPDMELYDDHFILIPEVSLMTGVRQWEHEGSSVIDHVNKFIERYQDKEIYGLFLSSSMNIRTMWQFYILNRESWIGKPVPVVPITLKQYVDIITFIYEKDLAIEDLKSLVKLIHKKTFVFSTYKEWQENISTTIEEWKQSSSSKRIIET
ncbi:hypothetical protein BKP35_07435 [Anaerobacillus arseniciselenatis]|uniref:Restriction endonuclease n=1 Tax=Anaerobacillus arseniciselenatis TaxID=85682 RepID=A0A1S2LNB7_9BACI|nr:AlwI family type II restriction endonuclease [Anaerobacillus arseniciselenatis]OIJ14029.1 hypothetical protein BKP35_07435 [Anaerobacillus arseniciselenatis]